jgi:ABC-2 type transport system permease protein
MAADLRSECLMAGTATDEMPPQPLGDLVDPASSRGLLDVWRRRYLVRLLVAKEIRVRYQGSFLGLLWTYVKPLVRYLVYYFVFGFVLGLNRQIENFPVYVFSGLIIVMFFNEALTSATRSVRGNRSLITKIFLPREMFPLVSLIVSTRHFLPQVGVLLVIALVYGWRPSWVALGAALLGFAVIFLFLLGLGLVMSTLNVYFKDAEQVVEIITMVAFWSAPVMYSWTLIADVIGYGWTLDLYLANPLSISVSLFHEAFWAPTVSDTGPVPDLVVPAAISAAIILLTLIVGQYVFSRFQGRFASEL